jgi:hypothetical protein
MLGTCTGARPWLGQGANEECNLPSPAPHPHGLQRLLPAGRQRAVAPRSGTAVETAVRELWDDLQIVEDAVGLAFLKEKPKITERLAPFTDERGVGAIQ